MRFELLPDRKEALELVCRWYFDEWGHDEEGTIELLTERITKKYLNSREIPLLLLGVEDQEVVGVCQLKFREMKMFPDYEHWLGGVYTAPKHRRKGVAQKVVTHAISVAQDNSVDTLYLQTEDLNGGLYERLGWEPIKKVIDRGDEVLVMQRKM